MKSVLADPSETQHVWVPGKQKEAGFYGVRAGRYTDAVRRSHPR